MNVIAVVLLIGMFSLSGCATKSPIEMASERGVDTAPNQAEINSCLQWVQAKEDKRLAKFDTMDSRDKAYVMINHDNMEMIKDVFGKGKNQCQPGTNVWDAYIAWVEAENKTKQALIAEGGSTIRFASGVAGAAYSVTELAAKAGDKIIGGDKTTAGQNVNKAGEGIETSGSQSTVSTTVKQTQVAAADSSATAQPSQSAVPAAVPASGTPPAETAPVVPVAPAVTP